MCTLVVDAEKILTETEVLEAKTEGSGMSLRLLTLSDVEVLPSVTSAMQGSLSLGSVLLDVGRATTTGSAVAELMMVEGEVMEGILSEGVMV